MCRCPAGGRGPHLLCGRRRLAFVAQSAHGAEPAIRCTSCTVTRCAPSEALEFCKLVQRVKPETLVADRSRVERAPPACSAMPRSCSASSSARHQAEGGRDLGARRARRAALFAAGAEASAKQDALIDAAQNLNVLRSRSPQHGEELIAWTDRFMASSGHRRNRGGATTAPRRLSGRRYRLARASGLSRRAVAQHHLPCRFRGASIMPAAPISRLSVFFRHVGMTNDRRSVAATARDCASTRMLDRARMLGAAMRVAYMVSASMPGVLPKTPLRVERGTAGVADGREMRGARGRPRQQPAAAARAIDRLRTAPRDRA